MASRFPWGLPTRAGAVRYFRDTDVNRHLITIEERAKKAPIGTDAYLFNEAGDLCVAADREFDARRYFGRSIDSFLDSGRFDTACAIARKILRHYPDVVRARCTIAWIAIGRGIRPEMAQALREYAGAARECGMDRPLVRELGWMADVVGDRDVLFEIGEWLLDVGASREADRVFGRAFWNQADTAAGESMWAAVVEFAKRDAWLAENGRKLGEFTMPADAPDLVRLD